MGERVSAKQAVKMKLPRGGIPERLGCNGGGLRQLRARGQEGEVDAVVAVRALVSGQRLHGGQGRLNQRHQCISGLLVGHCVKALLMRSLTVGSMVS